MKSFLPIRGMPLRPEHAPPPYAVPDGTIQPPPRNGNTPRLDPSYVPAIFRAHLSPNFRLGELCTSNIGFEYGFDNTPPNWTVLTNLHLLALMLEAVRRIVARPVRVTSGYRSDRVNHLAGGVPDSFHRGGLAADVQVSGFSPSQLWRRLRTAAQDAKDSGGGALGTFARRCDRVLLEPRWVHLVAAPDGPRDGAPSFRIAHGLAVANEPYIGS